MVWAVLGSQSCRENKLPTATFWDGFSTFYGEKKNIFFKYFCICTEKLHSIKGMKIFKTFGKYFILG